MKLHTNIKNHFERLGAEVVLWHDNTRPHTAELTKSMLTTLKFEVLTHTAWILAHVILKFLVR